MSKYHAKKTEIDGIVFDSKREAKRYQELKLLERAGGITHLELQPKFVLIPSFKKHGETFRAITYSADFQYCEKGQVVVEDVKGMKTEVFKIKHKLFERMYPDLTLKII